VRTPVERREALLDEFEGSSLSGVKFAALAGVKYATFAQWVQKRRKNPKPRETSGSGQEAGEPGVARPIWLFEAFAALENTEGSPAGLMIELPGGARVRVDSPAQLQLTAELLRLMGSQGGRPC